MIKKLRLKFILLSMTAMFLLLSGIVIGINIVNWRSVLSESDETLSYLAENGGVFPEPEQIPPPAPTAGAGTSKKPLPPRMSPEAPYENRYFSVLLGEDGQILHTDMRKIQAVSKQQAIEYASAIADSDKNQGFADIYRFLCRQEADGIRITFLDCSRSLISFRTFRLISIEMAFVGYVICSLIILFFSRWIVAPAAESYEKQKRFITDAGHEIKTPLSIILADADVLEAEIGENEWLEDMKKQIKRLADLTNDLVFLSRMEEGGSMPMIEFPVSDMVAETAASFTSLACTHGKDFQYEIQPELSMTGNVKSIQQLVNILLDNALKYSPESGSVKLTLKKQNKTLFLSVFNTAVNPISQEELPLLFERFYRTDPSRSSQTGGHGIGLSVAKAIVTAHNGKIQAKSDDGHSLCITASFSVPESRPASLVTESQIF